METKTFILRNWFTRSLDKPIWPSLLLLGAAIYGASFAYLNNIFHAHQWMAATGEAVYQRHEYWRAWTTLFAHADLIHLLGNSLPFVLFAYPLLTHFGRFFFPLAGLALGGLSNLLVLKTLPSSVTLLGISGVVHWMGAAWLTLFLLIDRREKLRPRFASALFLAMTLFLPETYRPEVSYLTHFIGFATGIGSRLLYYAIHRRQIAAAEIWRSVQIEEVDFDWSGNTDTEALPADCFFKPCAGDK